MMSRNENILWSSVIIGYNNWPFELIYNEDNDHILIYYKLFANQKKINHNCGKWQYE